MTQRPKVNFFVVQLTFVFMVSLCLFCAGCSNDEAAPPSQEKFPELKKSVVAPLSFLHEGIKLHSFEESSEALTVWRRFASQRPSLLMLSNTPLLIPVPEVVRKDVTKLIHSADAEDLVRRSTAHLANPLLLPEMTVDAAMRSQLLSRLIWVLPRRNQDQTMLLDEFSRQLKTSGLANEDEAGSLSVSNQALSGRLRDLPFWAGTVKNLPDLSGPIIVHIDLSYFQQLYRSEISTPVLPMIYETLRQLRERNLSVLAVTFAYGNLENRISLDVRYLGEVLKQLVENPAALEQPIPVDWQRQGTIIALANLFQKDKAREVALEMAKEEKEKAWVKFTLYRSAQQHGLGDKALAYLAQAVVVDEVYALEYLSLAELAYDKGRPDAALNMLELAGQAFPEEPFLQLKRAQLANEQGDVTTSKRLVVQLQKLPWSAVYYREIPEYLKSFADSLNGD